MRKSNDSNNYSSIDNVNSNITNNNYMNGNNKYGFSNPHHTNIII